MFWRSLFGLLSFFMVFWPLYYVFCRITASGYPFDIFKSVAIVLCLLSYYGFWLPLWYLQTFGHCIMSFFVLRLLVTPLISSNLWPLYYLSFFQIMASDYPFDIFKHLAIVLSVFFRITASDYPFDIFKLLAIVLSVLFSNYGFWLPLWYLQTFGHCIICLSLKFGFWLPLCYLQNVLVFCTNSLNILSIIHTYQFSWHSQYCYNNSHHVCI